MFPGSLLALEPVIKEHVAFLKSYHPCLECHTESEAKSFNDRERSCSNFCITCHEPHHQIEAWIRHKPLHDLPTRADGKIACYTCHDLTKQRVDKTAWRSQSLFETIFRKRKAYRTYYLRVNNTDGALCKSCH